MAKIVFALIATLFISAILQFPAFAAETKRPSSRTDSLGGLSLSSTVGSYFFAGSEHRSIAPLFGIKVGYEKVEKSVAESIGIEGTLNYFNSRSQVEKTNDTGFLYRLDVTYPFPINKKWVPFLAVGGGGIFVDSSASRYGNLLLNYGAGVKYFFENYLALRADARQLVAYENSNIRNNYEFSLGLSYYFGKERVKKATPLPVPEKKKIVVIEDVPVKPEEAAKAAEADAADKTAAVSPSAPASGDAAEIPVVKNEIVKKLSIGFDARSPVIKPEYIAQIKEAADILKGSGNLTVHIESHTDDSGKLAANRALSEQRAQSVRSSLIKSGVNPQQITVAVYGPEKPIADNETLEGRQKNRRVDIQVVKSTGTSTKLTPEQERQNEADRIENARLAAEILDKSGKKVDLVLQEVSGALPVDSNQSLSFEITNRGLNTDEYLLKITAPKDFDAFLARVNRPEEKITHIRLASGEVFKGNVLFRIPAGMADGQRTAVSVRAVSPKYSDVFFQKESTVVSSAPLVRVVAKLSKQEVFPGEAVRYRVTLLNSGSLAARNLIVKLQIPPQVDFIAAPDLKFTQEANGLMVFTVDSIDNGKSAELNVELKVREESVIGQELLLNVEVIDGTLQRRTKSTGRATVVRSK